MSEIKHFPFVAAIKRDNEQTKYRPKCSTFQGYLCDLESRKNAKGIWINKLKPIFNGHLLNESDKIRVREYKTIESVIGTPDEQFLMKFGKHEDLGYWIWNHDATERKKLEGKAEVTFYPKRQSEYDDDETEYRLKNAAFPKQVFEMIKNHCYEESAFGKTVFILKDSQKLEAELKNIHWTLKIK